MSTTQTVILLGAITLVLPLFLFMVAVTNNPSVNWSVLSNIFGGIVMTVFLIATIFEIKRLVDQH